MKRGVVLLAVALGALSGCATVGNAPAAGAASAATPGAPTPELQATYDRLLTRLGSGDATALPDLEKFSAANPGLAGPLLTLGLARARAGDEPAAERYYQRATQVCSRCGPAWNELGVLGRRQGRFAEAEQAYLRAIDLQPDYAPAYYNLAVLYELYVPRPELALQNYEHYLQLGGAEGVSPDVEKWVADLRRRVGGTAKAARAEGTS
ncbi:MAG: tetratricopeptide repeat protein [Chromatiales bacterium]|nr:tetratricopeptide repeat protein [Chromatiales bacterium]